MNPTEPNISVPQGGAFPPTRWSVVLNAGMDAAEARERALSELCRVYWYPLYAFARREGRDHDDAQDVTQAFFARLLNRDALSSAEKERGRFRSFLLAGFKHFVTDEWRKTQAERRGGGCEILQIDTSEGEVRFADATDSDRSRDTSFDREWALAMLERVNERLRLQYTEAGKEELYRNLRPHLMAQKSESYAELSERLEMKVGAVTMAIQRMRRRFGELVREEVGQTVADPGDVEGEVRWLMTILAGEGAK